MTSCQWSIVPMGPSLYHFRYMKKVSYRKQIACKHPCHKNFGHGREVP